MINLRQQQEVTVPHFVKKKKRLRTERAMPAAETSDLSSIIYTDKARRLKLRRLIQHQYPVQILSSLVVLLSCASPEFHLCCVLLC